MGRTLARGFNIVLAIGALVAVGVGLPPAHAARPIVIGVIAGLSGVNSVVAPAVVQSAALAVDEINAKGGVLGQKIEMATFDDNSGPDGAVKAFNTAIYQRKVNVIIAMETSAARNAGAPIAERAKVPFIYTSFYEGHACGKYLFVNAWVPEQVVPPTINYMDERYKAKRWFAVGSDYAFGRGMIAAAEAFIKQHGGTVVGEEFNPLDQSDWTPILSKVRGAHPDAIIYSTSGGAPNIDLMKQYRAAGFKLPVGSLSIDELTAQKAGQAAQGVYYAADYFTTLDNPENKRFLAAMKRKFGEKLLTPNDLSEPEYDGVYAYAMAVQQAKSTAAEAVIQALPKVAFKGPRGVVQMNKQHHAPLPMYLAQVQADGSSKIIKSYGLVDPGNQCPTLK